jgi:hypothetical protein
MGELCDLRQRDPCPVQGTIMNSIVLLRLLPSGDAGRLSVTQACKSGRMFGAEQ